MPTIYVVFKFFVLKDTRFKIVVVGVIKINGIISKHVSSVVCPPRQYLIFFLLNSW